MAKILASFCIAGGTIGTLFAAFVLSAELPGEGLKEPNDRKQAAPSEPSSDAKRVSVATARERAKLMHEIYAATLEMMHDRYFHDNRAVVPARALEDVFSELAKESKVEARWISVNTRAMGLRHEPRNEFEKQAAAEISAGKDEYELVEKGFYHRAGAIPLADRCVNCHAGFFKTPPKSPRFAGLVISVPVHEE
jgi:hypothetical protein